ncbi:hypothetical protein [Nocardioides euryhalodurans]|uniref:Polysaccharide biosynthesis protein n=1 Tax=Nocardioides euryhalodurans TaxID=2518370 RepID=A0A4P7GPX7_9ACTN|nr:hypothetical protein [Nocardioides euryhalodurans]QBR94183.1 hypothetical protein EXE57_19250 [Nocardioides euryhalodurans]
MASRLTGRGRLTISVADQVLASAAWYFPVLFVGRAVAPQEFGVFLVAYGALALAMAVSRAMFGVIVGMDVSSVSRSHEVLRLTTGGVLSSGAAAAALLLAAAVVASGGRTLVALLGVAAVVVLVQDLARYTAIAVGTPVVALLMDTVWLVPCVVGLALDVGGRLSLSATGGMSLWLAAGAGSLAVGALAGVLAPPRFSGLWGWWRGDARRRHLGADSALSGAVPVANGWGAALVAGATVVAAVRGAAMLFAPVATLMTAMTLAAVPEALRRRPREAVRLLGTLTGLLVLCAAGWGVIAALLPDAVGRGLIGDTWTVAESVVPIVSVEYVGLAMWTGGTALLRYASDTRAVLRARLLYAPAAAVLPVAALAIDDDPRLFAVVLAVLAWLVGGSTFAIGLRAARHKPEDDSVRSAPSPAQDS